MSSGDTASIEGSRGPKVKRGRRTRQGTGEGGGTGEYGVGKPRNGALPGRPAAGSAETRGGEDTEVVSRSAAQRTLRP